MPYIARYRCEFDTIKGRAVKIDIEQDVPSTLNIQALCVFDAVDDQVTIFDNDLSYLILGDIIVVTGTTNNNKTYTVKEVLYNSIGQIYTIVKFNESVTNETDGTVTFTITPATPISLTASSQSPLEIQYPNGEFEKMCAIRESKVRFKILADNVTASDFYVDEDTKYKVTIIINNNIEWVGWLDNNIITEPFLNIANEIELSANDGLSLLKTAELKLQNGEQMWGVNLPFNPPVFPDANGSLPQIAWYRLKLFIANALFPTKLGLDFVTFINQYSVNAGNFQRTIAFPDSDIFNQVGIYSTTFLRGTKEFDDCYQILSKIMQAFGCTLFQARGQWYIIQTNDRIAGVLDGTIRNSSATATGISMNQSFKIDIGLNEITKLINADALVSVEKPFKEVSIKYSFDLPPIYFRNFDFTDVGAGNVPLYWRAAHTNLANFYNLQDGGIVRVDTEAGTGAEIRRYLVFRGITLDYQGEAKETNLYPVNAGDRINFGFSMRYDSAIFRGANAGGWIVFTNSSGSIFYLGDDGSWSTARRQIGPFFNASEDRRFWKSFSITSQSVPGDGFISIVLTGWQSDIPFASGYYEAHFKDLSFSVTTQFNEMTQVDGYEQKSSTPKNLKNKYDNDLFISQSSNISTQGALLSNVLTKAKNYYYKNQFGSQLPFEKYISRSYWKTMWRNFIRLEGRLFDLYQDGRLLSPLNTVEFTEIESKEFMVTTLQMDIRQETAEFTMIELRDTSNNNDFIQNGIESFRYLNVKAKDENNPIKEPKTPIDWKYGTIGVITSLIRRNRRRRFNNYS
jgi:hypothetical protein